MGNPTYIIRNYHAEDFDTLVHLTTEVQELGQTGCLISPLDLIESVGQPHHSSQKDLFIAGRAGEIVGFADVRPELEIGRTVLRLLVHPKHHKRGLAAKLVDRAISRTRELGLVTLHVNILHDSPVAKQLLTKMGFTLIREFLELRLDFSKTDLPEISNTAPRCRSLQPGEEEKLTQLQNRSFTGSWGYNVNTVEEIIYRISLPNSFPEDILLAFDSDKPIGYCWTRISFWKNKTSGEGSGRITMLGVDPDYRGRGLGRHILFAGLSYLKSKDLRVVEVTVDSENQTAYALYKSVGFEFWTSSLWYEKRLD
jgi:mycothiol synthase